MADKVLLTIEGNSASAVKALDKTSKELAGMKKQASGMKGVLQNFKKNWLAITAALGGTVFVAKKAIKAASDLQETTQKYGVVFKGVRKEADAMAKNLQNNYGMSSRMAKQYLSDTSDLLQGVGMAKETSLDFANAVAIAGTDLASFTNFSGGAEGAILAIQKALLGERESLKALQIAINETDVSRQMAVNSAKGMTFESDRAAKAQATLDLIMQQSKNSVNDFNRSIGSFANQSRIMDAAIEDASASIGEALLPVITPVVSMVAKAARAFSQLPFPVRAAAVALGVMGIAIKVLSVLLAGLNFNPTILAITGVVAVVGGLALVFSRLSEDLERTKKNIEAQTDAEKENMERLKRRTELLKEQIGLENISAKKKQSLTNELIITQNALQKLNEQHIQNIDLLQKTKDKLEENKEKEKEKGEADRAETERILAAMRAKAEAAAAADEDLKNSTEKEAELLEFKTMSEAEALQKREANKQKAESIRLVAMKKYYKKFSELSKMQRIDVINTYKAQEAAAKKNYETRKYYFDAGIRAAITAAAEEKATVKSVAGAVIKSLASALAEAMTIRAIAAAASLNFVSAALYSAAAVAIKIAGNKAATAITGMQTGGIIDEPVYGVGANTGQRYAFGESGSEKVVPLSDNRNYDQGVNFYIDTITVQANDPMEFAQKLKEVKTMMGVSTL